MSIILLKNIEHADKVSAAGKPYTSCKITVWNKKENKDTFISGFGNGITKSWNAGDTVDVVLSQTEKGYWNFDLNENSKPSENPVVKILKDILAELKILNGAKLDTIIKETAEDFGGIVEQEPMPTIEPGSAEEVKVEDIPF